MINPQRAFILKKWKIESCGHGVRVVGTIQRSDSFKDGATIRSSNIIAVCGDACLCEDGALYSLGEDFHRFHEDLRQMLPKRSPSGGIESSTFQATPPKLGIIDASETVRLIFNQSIFSKHFNVDFLTTPEEAVDQINCGHIDIAAIRVLGQGAVGVRLIQMLSHVNTAYHTSLFVLESFQEWNLLFQAASIQESTSGQGKLQLHSFSLLQRLKPLVKNTDTGDLSPNAVEPICLPIEVQNLNLERFSPREAEILGLRSVGLSCKEVATRLNISTMTVYAHARNAARRVRYFISSARKGSSSLSVCQWQGRESLPATK
jgi:DNA-binding NarL/FixJ family response regulator